MRKSLCTNLLRKKTNGKNNCRICISQIQIQIRGGTGRDIVGAQLPTAALSANSTLIRRNVCQKWKKKIARQKPASSYRTQQRRQWRRQLRRQSAPSTVVIKCCPSQLPICHLKIKFRLIYKGAHCEWPRVSIGASSQGDFNERFECNL